mgnify:CR=1 FL=1
MAYHGIEDIYETTYIRKDSSCFPTMVSVAVLRVAQHGTACHDDRHRRQGAQAVRRPT